MRISDWSSDVCSSDLIIDGGVDRSSAAAMHSVPGCAVTLEKSPNAASARHANAMASADRELSDRDAYSIFGRHCGGGVSPNPLARVARSNGGTPVSKAASAQPA